jgi:hypothetical protein
VQGCTVGKILSAIFPGASPCEPQPTGYVLGGIVGVAVGRSGDVGAMTFGPATPTRDVDTCSPAACRPAPPAGWCDRQGTFGKRAQRRSTHPGVGGPGRHTVHPIGSITVYLPGIACPLAVEVSGSTGRSSESGVGVCELTGSRRDGW